MNNKGHNILRLPPYHPDLNPIELVWADIKEYMARRQVSYTISQTEMLCKEKVLSMSPDNWVRKC